VNRFSLLTLKFSPTTQHLKGRDRRAPSWEHPEFANISVGALA